MIGNHNYGTELVEIIFFVHLDCDDPDTSHKANEDIEKHVDKMAHLVAEILFRMKKQLANREADNGEQYRPHAENGK